MQSSPRRLVLMRHAPAESGGNDRQRELTAAGAAVAREVGVWLSQQQLSPDAVLSSSALRARRTFEAVAEGAGWDVQADFDDGIYEGGAETVLDLLHEAEPEVGTLMLVGHNPTVALVATLLDDGEGDPDAQLAMASGFPAATVAVFDVDQIWADLSSARLVGFRPGAH